MDGQITQYNTSSYLNGAVVALQVTAKNTFPKRHDCQECHWKGVPGFCYMVTVWLGLGTNTTWLGKENISIRLKVTMFLCLFSYILTYVASLT